MPITLRPAAKDDEPFLYHLYRMSRAEEFAHVAWVEAQFDALMQMEYGAQKQSYEGQFSDSQHSIVIVDGLDAGQIWVFRSDSEDRLVDISISAEYQSHGMGSELMARLIRDAEKSGVPLTCSVATNNPGSLRFHQRLGFEITNQDQLYYSLEYPVGKSAVE